MNTSVYNRPITVCGLAGVGKSVLITSLCTALCFKKYSAGDFARELAVSMFPKLSPPNALLELEKLAENNEGIDLEIDRRSEELEKSPEKKWILDSRLGWHFCPSSFKVLLVCDDAIRIERVGLRDKQAIALATQKTKEREDSIRLRYQKYYGIEDFTNPSLFDFVVDTSYKQPSTVFTEVLETYQRSNLS